MPLRRSTRFTGLFPEESITDSFWIRETGTILLPALDHAPALALVGELLLASPHDPTAAGPLGLELKLDGQTVLTRAAIEPGPFRFELAWPAFTTPAGHQLELQLLGVSGSNFLAWLGRLSGLGFLRAWRAQGRNRRLRIQRIEAGSDILFDFSNRASPWNQAIARRSLKVGLNLTGFFRAVLGIGESVRCAARAAEAAGLPHACVELKLPCKNQRTIRIR
jgi:hypothetical protein